MRYVLKNQKVTFNRTEKPVFFSKLGKDRKRLFMIASASFIASANSWNAENLWFFKGWQKVFDLLYMDKDLIQKEYVYFNPGVHDKSFKVKSWDLKKLCNPKML